MALTPRDIHNKEFQTKFRGFDQEEVVDFLDQIQKDYEASLRENDRLNEEIRQYEEKLKYFNDLKDSLNQSIIVAQEAADKVKANSQREADIINREAQKQGQDIIDQANEKARHIIDEAAAKAKQLAIETDDLKKQARIFRQKLQVMLESQLEVVKGSEWDEILKQGDTSTYEEIQNAIREDDAMNKEDVMTVQSFTANAPQEQQVAPDTNDEPETPASDEAQAEVNGGADDDEEQTVVIFPDTNDEPAGRHYSQGNVVDDDEQ